MVWPHQKLTDWMGSAKAKHNPPRMQQKGDKLILLPLVQTSRIFSSAIRDNTGKRLKLPKNIEIEPTTIAVSVVQTMLQQLKKRMLANDHTSTLIVKAAKPYKVATRPGAPAGVTSWATPMYFPQQIKLIFASLPLCQVELQEVGIMTCPRSEEALVEATQL